MKKTIARENSDDASKFQADHNHAVESAALPKFAKFSTTCAATTYESIKYTSIYSTLQITTWSNPARH